MPGTSTGGMPIPLDSDPACDLADSVRDVVDALEAAWVAYTPVWTAVTTNPVIGNGTLLGRYKRIGKTVLFRVQIVAGSTTTGGSGNYSVSLPLAAHASGRQIVTGDVVYAGGPIIVRGRIEASGTSAALWVPGTTAGSYERGLTGAVPAALAAGVTLVVEGAYEAA